MDYVYGLNRLNEFFYVWMASYHRDSYFPAVFCRYKRIRTGFNMNIIRIEFSRRKKAGFVLISNCDGDHSIRIKYIKDLMKYYPIEVYGDCFGRRLSEMEKLYLFDRRLFFVAFENSVCKDYVTEKYCNGISFGTIPIVMHPEFNTRNLIPGSFINALDYESPKHLAEHLEKISNNFKLYKKYFEWKKNYKIIHHNITVDVCRIMDKLYEANITKSVKSDPVYSIFNTWQRCLPLDKLTDLAYKK